MKKVDFKRLLLVILFIIVVVFACVNISFIWDAISVIFKVLTPFIYGFVIAYVLNYVYKLFYYHAFKKMGTKNEKLKKVRKPLSITITYILALGVIAVLLAITIPEIVKSVEALINDIPVIVKNLIKFVNDTITFIDTKTGLKIKDTVNYKNFIKLLTGGNASSTAQSTISSAVTFVKSMFTSVYNWIIGLIISVYMLSSKEKLYAGVMKLIDAYIPKRGLKVKKVITITDEKCGKFLSGKIIDCIILGVLYFIVLEIFNLEYAALIALVMGVTNIIPFFGPFIGAIPSAFVLLLTKPIDCLWFLIIMLVLQQIDGNILSPKILGDSVGLSGFWILFAVIVGGGLFGFPGMILGVPIFAVIYCLLRDDTNKRLGIKFKVRKQAVSNRKTTED